MFCSKCGNQMPDGAKFCGKCGNRTDANPGAAAATSRVVIGGEGGAAKRPVSPPVERGPVSGGPAGYGSTGGIPTGVGYDGTGGASTGTGYPGKASDYGTHTPGYEDRSYRDGGYDYREEKENPVKRLLGKLNKKVLIIALAALVVIVAGVVVVNLVFGGSSGSGGGDTLVFVQDNMLMLAEKPGDEDLITLNDEYLSDDVMDDTSYDAAFAANTGSFSYTSDGKYLFYLADYDDYSDGHLYQVKLSRLKAGKESENITSVAKNVVEFVVVGDYVYYRKSNGALCCYDVSQNKSITIEKDASSTYYISEDGKLVLYTNLDGDLYLSEADGEKEVRIAKDISYVDYASEDLRTITYETYNEDKGLYSLYNVSVKNFEITSEEKRVDDVAYVDFADDTRAVYSEREENKDTGYDEWSLTYVDGDLTQTLAEDCMACGVEASRNRSGFPTGYYRIAKYAFAEPEMLLMYWTEGDYEKNENYISVNGGPAMEISCDGLTAYAYDAKNELLYLDCYSVNKEYEYEYVLLSYSTKNDELTGEVELCSDCRSVSVYEGYAYFLCDDDLCYSKDGQTYEVLAGDVDNTFTLYADSDSDRMLLWVEDEGSIGQITLYDKGEKLMFAEDVHAGNCAFRGSKGLLYVDDYDDGDGGTLKYFNGKDSQRLEEDVWALGPCNQMDTVLTYYYYE